MAGIKRDGGEMPVASNTHTDSMDGGHEDNGGFTPPPRRHAIASMACVMLAMFLSALSQTVVATTMPLIIADVGGFDQYTWAATSYLLTATLAYPIVGRLSDIYGRRRFLLLGLAIFCAGSVFLGFSESMTQVVVFRGLQGVGGGAVATCCFACIADLFRPKDRGRFHGILSAVYGVSFIIGPVIGGILADALSWQWTFLIIGLAGIPVFALTARMFPKPPSPPEDPHLDLKGMIALGLALPPFLVALSTGGVRYEWGSTIILCMLLFSLAMTGVFIIIELRARSPIVPLSLYADRVVGLSVAIMLLASFGLYGCVLFLPLFFQVVFGLSAAQSGGLLVPLLLGMVVGGVVAGLMLSRITGHYRILATVFSGLMSAGLYLLSTMDATTGIVQSQIYIVVAGLGTGGIIATISVGVQNHVPHKIVGVATSALQFYRSVGGVIGLAVLGIVLATQFVSSLEEALPEAVKAELADGQLDDWSRDLRVFGDSPSEERLREDLTAVGLNESALVRDLLNSIRNALQESLDSVFLVAFFAAAIAAGLAMFFQVKVRSEAAPGDADDTGGQPRH
ncbi:MAG: MFS transporter [Albidovulum sp.]|nr:MFS transporter [Albidovulum sp.]